MEGDNCLGMCIKAFETGKGIAQNFEKALLLKPLQHPDVFVNLFQMGKSKTIQKPLNSKGASIFKKMPEDKKAI
jgi:hypothetical protein